MYIYPFLIISLGLVNSSVHQLQQSLVNPVLKKTFQTENISYSADSFSYYKNTSSPKDTKFKVEQAEKQRLLEAQQAEELAEQQRLQALAVEAAKRKVVYVAKVTAPAPSRVDGNFVGAIIEKCAVFGCNPDQLVRVMYCESGGRSNARNGIHTGLFQFNPRTFAANANRSGVPGADIYNPYQQIHVAAWMFSQGQARQWSCK